MPENTIFKILKYGVYFSLIWLFLIFRETLYPSFTVRVLFFQGIMEILFVFYFFLIIRFPQYRPKLNALLASVAVWLAALFLSAILGADFWSSFFGQLERMTGIFFILHIVIFFLIISAVFKTWEDWRNFLMANVVAGLIHSALALYQRIDENFLTWLYWTKDAERIFGLFANPSFLSGYLVFTFFISLFLLLKSDNYKIKLFNIFSIFVFLLDIIFSGTRGSLLGLAAGLAVFSLIYAIFSGNRKVKLLTFSFIGIVALATIFLWANRDSQWMDQLPALKRIFGTTKKELLLGPRKMLWESAWAGFKDNPILGWGTENFNLVFDKHYSRHILSAGIAESRPTKPHNVFLEHLAGGGIIGLLSFLTVFAAAGYLLFKSFKKDTGNLPAFAAFSSLFVAHLLQSAVLFDTPYTYYMTFIILGFASFLSGSQNQVFYNIKINRDSEKVVLFLASAFAIFLIYLNISTLISAYYSYKYNLKFISTTSFYNNENLVDYIDSYSRGMIKYKTKEDEKNALLTINSKLDEVIDKNPKNILYLTAKAQLLNGMGAVIDGKYSDEAIDFVGDIIKSRPDRAILYLLRGFFYLSKGDIKMAIENYEESVRIDPLASVSHWYLGYALYADGQKTEALENLDFAYNDGYSPTDASHYQFWATAYAEDAIYDKAIDLLERAIKINPINPEYYQKLAAIYKELGDKTKAIEMARKAVELDPSLQKEAEEFIELLK